MVNPSLYAQAAYDPYKDCVPVMVIGASPNVFVVPAQSDDTSSCQAGKAFQQVTTDTAVLTCQIALPRDGRIYAIGSADLHGSSTYTGIEFLKVDGVGPGSFRGGDNYNNIPDVAAWQAAIAKTGRAIHFELSWSLDRNYAADWKRYANGWRIDTDVEYLPTDRIAQ